MSEQRRPDDLLTAQDIADQYGINPRVVESLMRNLGNRDLVFRIDGFKRDFVRRRDIEPQSLGGAKCA